MTRRIAVAWFVMSALVGPAPSGARAQPRMLGIDFAGVLYDVDPATGAASNPRGTGLLTPMDLAWSPLDRTLYTARTAGLGNDLWRIDPVSGAATRVGPILTPDTVEGALAAHPVSGLLYLGHTFGPQLDQLYTIDPRTLQATFRGVITPPGGNIHDDISGLTVRRRGQPLRHRRIDGRISRQPLDHQLGDGGGPAARPPQRGTTRLDPGLPARPALRQVSSSPTAAAPIRWARTRCTRSTWPPAS